MTLKALVGELCQQAAAIDDALHRARSGLEGVNAAPRSEASADHELSCERLQQALNDICAILGPPAGLGATVAAEKCAGAHAGSAPTPIPELVGVLAESAEERARSLVMPPDAGAHVLDWVHQGAHSAAGGAMVIAAPKVGPLVAPQMPRDAEYSLKRHGQGLINALDGMGQPLALVLWPGGEAGDPPGHAITAVIAVRDERLMRALQGALFYMLAQLARGEQPGVVVDPEEAAPCPA